MLQKISYHKRHARLFGTNVAFQTSTGTLAWNATAFLMRSYLNISIATCKDASRIQTLEPTVHVVSQNLVELPFWLEVCWVLVWGKLTSSPRAFKYQEGQFLRRLHHSSGLLKEHSILFRHSTGVAYVLVGCMMLIFGYFLKENWGLLSDCDLLHKPASCRQQSYCKG